MEIGGDMSYEYKAKTAAFDQDLKSFIVNTKVSRKFLKTVTAPLKGKVKDNKGFREVLNSFMKDWGDYAQSWLKSLLL